MFEQDQDAFRRISSIARNIQSVTQGNDSPSPPSHNIHHSIDTLDLTLPLPGALTSSAESSAALCSISDTFLRSVQGIRDMYQTKHQKMSSFLASDPNGLSTRLDYLRSFFERQYRDQVNEMKRLALDRINKLREDSRSSKPKPVFNQEFVPLLEKYFEYNAYPSAIDRAALARKSMMSARQIEVWFQNHRNRAKKDGKTLRKLTTDPLPLKLSLESLEKKMPFFVIPEKDRRDPFQVNISNQEQDSDSDDDVVTPSHPDINENFNLVAPPHAFPTTYPPRCDYEAFPTPAKFPAPAWYRKPATARLVYPPIDFEDFILDFSLKLILREPPSRKQRRKDTDAPWFAWRHTVPSPAPHPALVRPFTSLPSRRLPPMLHTIPAPTARLHPFRSPSPCAKPATLIPPQQQTSPTTRRKVARLPNRTPKNPSTTHRRGSPAISEASPSPSSRSLSSSSRSSSFGSDTPSKRRPSSSSSSSSSSPPSALTTPTLPHATLPDDTRSPTVSVAGLDFQNMDDLFGDSNSALSPIEGLPLDFHTVAPRKQGLDFSISLPTAGLLQQRS